MIIAGAGSAGKETLFALLSENKNEDIVFYDDNSNIDALFGKYQVINSIELLQEYLKINPKFCVAIGNPRKREAMYNKIIKAGGIPQNVYSNHFDSIEKPENNGSIYQPGVVLSHDVKIGLSCMIHANTVIGHKSIIGNFVNISPLCSIIGPVKIGNLSYIGAGSVILPNVNIGKNVIVVAGSIVNRDIHDFETYE